MNFDYCRSTRLWRLDFFHYADHDTKSFKGIRSGIKVLTFTSGSAYPSDNPELEDVLTSSDVDHVAQIFQTPLTGSYNWDYSVQDDRIKKLYELGKQLNWDPQMDINWDQPWPEEEGQAELMNLNVYPTYLALSNKDRDEFWSLEGSNY